MRPTVPSTLACSTRSTTQECVLADSSVKDLVPDHRRKIEYRMFGQGVAPLCPALDCGEIQATRKSLAKGLLVRCRTLSLLLPVAWCGTVSLFREVNVHAGRLRGGATICACASEVSSNQAVRMFQQRRLELMLGCAERISAGATRRICV